MRNVWLHITIASLLQMRNLWLREAAVDGGEEVDGASAVAWGTVSARDEDPNSAAGRRRPVR
jgi:hypothetical protein